MSPLQVSPAGQSSDALVRPEVLHGQQAAVREHYGKATRELIFSPVGNRQIWNGQNHYTPASPSGCDFDHVALGDGQRRLAAAGVEPSIYNGTGRPENVQSAAQRGELVNEVRGLREDISGLREDTRNLAYGVARVMGLVMERQNMALADSLAYG